MPIKGQSKTTKTRICQLFHENHTYCGKNLDRCWARRIFNLRLWSVEDIDSSSSSWKSTQRGWWSDWILENQRWSSEIFPALSSLVLTTNGRKAWQEEETRKDTSIVLIHQEQSCTSELFKAIQDAVSLILHYRTMYALSPRRWGPITRTSPPQVMSEICTVIFWQDYCRKGNLRKSYWNMGWEKIPNWECLFVHREKGLFLSVYVDDIKLDGKKQNIDPMWKLLNKDVDVGEPTSFLDHVYLGCTQRQCEISKDIVDNLQNHVWITNFRGGTAQLPCSENIRISSWSYDVEGRAKKCVWTILWVGKQDDSTTLQSIYSMQSMTNHFKEEELKSVGELSKICSQIVLKCWNLAQIGRPDILWSVNKLARSITKWTKACDKRLSRLISYINHSCEYKQYCYVGNTARQCRLGLFQDSDFAGDLEDSKSTSGGHYAFLEVMHLFQ